MAPWMAEALLVSMVFGPTTSLAEKIFELANNHLQAYPGSQGGPWDEVRLSLLLECAGTGLDEALSDAAHRAKDLVPAPAIALTLFTYAEALRAPHFPRRQAHARARRFFELAAPFDGLEGVVARNLGFLRT